MKKSDTVLTSNDLRRGQFAVEEELQQARAAHAKAAYEHALDRDDTTKRDALISAKQTLDLLTAELQGLQAATGEATRREGVEALEGEISALEQRRADALATIDQVPPAFARTYQAIQELGAAWKALQQVELDANRSEAQLAPMPRGDQLYPFSFRLRPIVDCLLWQAIGGDWELRRDDLLTDVGGNHHPERALEVVAKKHERSRAEVVRGVDRKVQELTARAQQQRQAA